MAPMVGLSAYKFQIKNRRHGSGWWTFAIGGDSDGYNAVRNYLRARKAKLMRLGQPDGDGTYVDQRAILLAKVVRNEDRRMLAGLMLKGEAGAVKQIRNFDDPEADPSYTTAVNEGILTPLYFRFHLEDARSFGVLLLQTFGIDGMKSYIDADLRRYFRDEVADPCTIRIQQLLDLQVLEAFAKNGQLQDVVLVNSGKSQASRKSMERHAVGGDHLGRNGDKLAMRLHRRDGWSHRVLRRVWKAIKDGHDPTDLVDAPSFGKIEDFRVEIKHAGQTQTFSLLNPDDSPIRYTIPNTAFGADGHPTWESIHNAADNVWDHVRGIIDGGR